MENYQKIEQIVKTTGCSFEDAKAALEAHGWDMIDAVIGLERDGRIKKETAAQSAPKAEETVEITAEVRRDDDTAGRKDSSGNSGSAEKKPHRVRGFFRRIKEILLNNRMLVFKSSGQKILDIPIIVPVIALIAFFWATLIVAVLAMIFGYRFHFEGEDLGKTNINDTMDKATDYAEKVKDNLTGKPNGEQNTDN